MMTEECGCKDSSPGRFSLPAAGTGAESAAWMVYGVQGLQPFPGDVSVDLRRRDIGVAEQHLDDAEVGAVVDQVRREGMAQRVRR